MKWADFIAYSNQFPLQTTTGLTPRVLGLLLVSLANSEFDFEFATEVERDDYRSIVALAIDELTP